MKRKDKDSRIKYKSLNNQNRDYKVNPKFIRIEIPPFKVIPFKNKLEKISSNLYDWRNHSKSYSKNYNHRVDMDAKINHRKKREGD